MAGGIQKLLNVALPPILSLIILSTLTLPFLFFKLLLHVKKLVYSENMEMKVVLITGAASGIGEQLAYEYARRGALLSLVDNRKENLGAVADMARFLGSPDVIIIGADVSNFLDSKRFVDETVNYFGRLDHLVNNAGTSTLTEVENSRDVASVFPSVMDDNFWGAVYGTLFAVPHLKNSKGRIIVTASACGWLPLPRMSIYNASEAAVINFFETLRIELGWAIGVTIATPSWIKTEITSKAIDGEASLGRIPMGSACECAKAIVKSACRGDMYVTNPSWLKMMFPLKVCFPELVDWGKRMVFGISPFNSTKKGNQHLYRNPEHKTE